MPTNLTSKIHEWLGIPEGESGSHYRWLGLAELENDRRVIEFVAGWRIAFVEARLGGPDGDAAAQILERLRQARRTLLSDVLKAKLDGELRRAMPDLRDVPPAHPSDTARCCLGVVAWHEACSDRELLGIAADETNPLVLKAQFDQRMAGLRAFEKVCIGEEQLQIAQLINRLARAERQVAKSLADPVTAVNKTSPSGTGADFLEVGGSSDRMPVFQIVGLPQDGELIGSPLSMTGLTTAVSAPMPVAWGGQKKRRGFWRRHGLMVTNILLGMAILAVAGWGLSRTELLGQGVLQEARSTVAATPKTDVPSVSQDTVNPAESAPQAAQSMAKRSVKVSAPPVSPIVNGDFRKGLDGWKQEGDASRFFVFPVDDSFSVTTFGRPGGDSLMGRLYQHFEVPRKAAELSFHVHGGRNGTRIALIHDGKVYRSVTGRNSNTPFLVAWDIETLRGKHVTFEISDQRKQVGWSFIGIRGVEMTFDDDE